MISQAYALFYARSVGEGTLRASLMQIGMGPGEVWRSESPLTGSVAVHVVSPVFFRLLPSFEDPIINITNTNHQQQQQPHLRQLTAPLILAPGTTFPLEPAGGSGNKP